MIRAMRADDIGQVATLADARRQQYAGYQPQFWRVADDAIERHVAFLHLLVADESVVSLVSDDGGSLTGFVIGRVVPAPPVYDPGGPTGSIDDFTVADDADWPTVGSALLRAARSALRTAGAVQVVVVCAAHDLAKREALRAAGMDVASEWFVAPLHDGADDAHEH